MLLTIFLQYNYTLDQFFIVCYAEQYNQIPQLFVLVGYTISLQDNKNKQKESLHFFFFRFHFSFLFMYTIMFRAGKCYT